MDEMEIRDIGFIFFLPKDERRIRKNKMTLQTWHVFNVFKSKCVWKYLSEDHSEQNRDSVFVTLMAVPCKLHLSEVTERSGPAYIKV